MSQINREQAMNARPVATEFLRRQPQEGGYTRVTIHVHPQGVHRWLLRMPERVERSFDLDQFGLEVLGMCDGQKTVRYIIDKFARKHRINAHEAEQAVLTFLRTMVRKQLVTLVVRK